MVAATCLLDPPLSTRLRARAVFVVERASLFLDPPLLWRAPAHMPCSLSLPSEANAVVPVQPLSEVIRNPDFIRYTDCPPRSSKPPSTLLRG